MRLVSTTNGTTGVNNNFKMQTIIDEDHRVQRICRAGMTNKLAGICQCGGIGTSRNLQGAIDNRQAGHVIPACRCQWHRFV